MKKVCCFVLNKRLPCYLLFFSVFIFTAAFSQTEITGTITGRQGEPLSGATISIKKTNTFSTSDTAGHFTIKAAPGAVIEFSFIGYGNRSVVLGKEAIVNILLDETAQNLDDVVVIGYGTVKKKDLTGAVAPVAAKDFNKGIYASPDQLIQGKVSGVQIINNSGQPGWCNHRKNQGQFGTFRNRAAIVCN